MLIELKFRNNIYIYLAWKKVIYDDVMPRQNIERLKDIELAKPNLNLKPTLNLTLILTLNQGFSTCVPRRQIWCSAER